MIHAAAPDVPSPEIHLELDNIMIYTPYTYPYTQDLLQIDKCTESALPASALNHHTFGCRPMGNPIEGPP